MAGQSQNSNQSSNSKQTSASNSQSNDTSALASSKPQSSDSLASTGNIPSVKLQDLADIKIGDERQSISKTNGKDAVNVQVMKAQDANTVQVAKDVQQTIDKFTQNNAKIDGVKTMDTAKPIQDSLYTMVEKAALGTMVAIIVILLFLRNIRTTAISIVSIPLSILIALVALKLTDVSLNILTLGALTIAIGRVIDDSIVVVENIYRRLSDPKEQLKGIH